MYQFELYNLLAIIGICWFQKNWFEKNMPVGTLFHALWMLPFIALWTICFLVLHSWLIIGVLVLQRFVMFSPTLNLMRGKPFFYLATGADSGDAAKTDLLLESVAPAYPYLWSIMAALLLVINIVKL